MIHQTVYSFHGGSFTRNLTKGGDAFWVEHQDYLADEYQFIETSNDGQYYYALGRSIVTIKIPIKGGHSYYSGDDGKNWTPNHYVTLTSNEDVGDIEEIAIDNDLEESTTETNPTKLSIKFNPVTSSAVLSPCKDSKNLRIEGSVEATEILFVNHLQEAVQLFWVDYDQNLVPYAILQPEEKFTQGTYSNHWWMAKTLKGGCIGIFKNEETTPITVDIERKVIPIQLKTADESGLKRNK